MNTHAPQTPCEQDMPSRSYVWKVRAAFALAFFSAVFGLAFCLTKSPQAKSEAYLAVAVHAYEKQDNQAALYAAMEAARYNPAGAQSWSLLASVLARRGEWQRAESALTLASRLQNRPVSVLSLQPQTAPVYATPAALRLGFLIPPSSGVEMR